MTIKQAVLLVPEVKMFLETFDIGTERLVLIGKLGVEILLEVQVTSHICNFSVPKVELTSLLLIVLLHQGDTARHIPCTTLLVLERRLQRLDAISQGLLVRIEGSSQRLSPLPFLAGFHLLQL